MFKSGMDESMSMPSPSSMVQKDLNLWLVELGAEPDLRGKGQRGPLPRLCHDQPDILRLLHQAKAGAELSTAGQGSPY